MKTVFLFAKTDAVVAPDRKSRTKFVRAVEGARDRAVIIQTPVMTGAGAIIGDKVITSLLLVANFTEVLIRFAKGKRMPAFVTRRDYTHNLAELVPSSRGLSGGDYTPLASSSNPKLGEIREVGSPLLVVDVGSGVPVVNVAGTRYMTSLAERFEDQLKIKPNAPRGLIGGAVWGVDGRFVGLTIGEKIPPANDPTDPQFPSVYALPSREVMEFVESN